MATQVLVDQLTTITVEFRDVSSQGTGELVDMAVVEVSIDSIAATPDFDSPNIDATEEFPGVYSYEWTPDTEGSFVVRFRGSTEGGDITLVEEFFDVVSSLTSGGGTALGSTVEFSFIGGISPIYVDPEEILSIFPAADPVDVTEAIHRFSLEADKILGPNILEIPLLAIDFVKHSVLCYLSRTIGDAESAGVEETITLGDLSISKGSSSASSSGALNRANAGTWCELAALFRQELIRSHRGMKGVVRGRKHRNPMPPRHLRDHDWGSRNRARNSR